VAFNIDIAKILQAFGFKNVYIATTESDVKANINKLKIDEEVSALIVNVSLYSRKNLGRPTISPAENKAAFEKALCNKSQS